MPYEGQFADYRALQRIADTERVQQLLRRSRVFRPDETAPAPAPMAAPDPVAELPHFVVAIDGSNHEVAVRNGYPGAQVGYLTVASVLLDMGLIDTLDASRPADPREFRKTEQAATIDAALPGSNVVTRTHASARTAFREEFYDVLHEAIVDTEDRVRLQETYEALLALKPETNAQKCPYSDEGCDERVTVGPGLTSCPCPSSRSIWSTDALRIHEGFRAEGSNGEVLGEVMQVWERILLVHLLRAFERRELLGLTDRVAFFLDGPLAVFGHPAWLSAAISRELKRINELARRETGRDIVVVGIEKGGTFVTHFEALDVTDSGEARFGPRTYLLPTDSYIKERVIFSDSPKRYGEDTYFGRKLFYKTASGSQIVASIPFLSAEQDTLASDDPDLYPSLPLVFTLLDKLCTTRFPNALSPIVSAHSHAAIPLNLGAKVLEQLAQALMRDS